jgi:predicted HTH transcriptional regulator
MHSEAEFLDSLLSQSESEWIEFKHNNCSPDVIGETISAVSNAARLHQQDAAYIIWSIADGTRQVHGTTFRPHAEKVGAQELENWIATQLEPRIEFKIREMEHQEKPVVVFSIQPCSDRPVSFRGVEYIRVGSYTKKLRDHPEKERALWAKSHLIAFEREIATRNVPTDDVLRLLDYGAYFELAHQPVPSGPVEILGKLENEKLLARSGDSRWNVTNLGALLFAKRLTKFESLARKAVRVVTYRGRDRTDTITEQVGDRGYASGFAGLVTYINDKLPTNEQIGQALRRQVRECIRRLPFANSSPTQSSTRIFDCMV